MARGAAGLVAEQLPAAIGGLSIEAAFWRLRRSTSRQATRQRSATATGHVRSEILSFESSGFILNRPERWSAQLQADGITAFRFSFDQLVAAVGHKRRQIFTAAS